MLTYQEEGEGEEGEQHPLYQIGGLGEEDQVVQMVEGVEHHEDP